MTKNHEDPFGRVATSSFAVPLFLLLFAGGIVGAAIFVWSRAQPNYDLVSASSGRVGLEHEGGDLATVDRRQRQELWYRVTLEQAPLGAQAPLECEWVAPDGRTMHRNKYETRTIDKTPWDTHARYQLAADSPLGTWTVKLLLQGRVLHSKKFELQEGVAERAERN